MSIETTNATATENAGRLFTQDEVNRIVSERLARERAKTESSPADDETYKAKYESVLAELNGLKVAQLRQKKTDVYRDLLTRANINEKRFPIVLRASGAEIDALELDDNGAVVDADKIVKAIQEEWADFVVHETVRGAEVYNPPFNVANRLPDKDKEIADIFKPKI